MRRTRLLALFVDLLVCAAPADVAGLALTLIVWRVLPAARPVIPWLWGALALAAVAAFLLRDAQGGRARRWLGLEARRTDGRLPGWRGSILRNLALLIPGWNLFDVWPVLRDGQATRRCDEAAGIRILRIT